jgi:tripeptide aminopeptidase
MSELSDLLCELCSEPSPSYREAGVARLIKTELDARGLEWSEDDTAALTGSDCGNILVRIPGEAGAPSEPILLCAHMDTVPLTDSPAPVLADGFWASAGDGILGIDNKPAEAAILCAARSWAARPPRVPVEILFTVAEEVGLRGAKAFDASKLHSRLAVMFDHPTPLGTIVGASPTHQTFVADFTGRAAHAGVHPEMGRSAIAASADAISRIPIGRVDSVTTCNIGLVAGGTAINVVPEYCRIEGEVRGLSEEAVATTVAEVTEALQTAADSHACTVALEISKSFSGYEHPASHPARDLADRAIGRIGLDPVVISSAGGSDANVLEERGISSVNLGDGSLDTHTRDERISNEDLHRLLNLIAALPDVRAEVLGSA